MKCWRSFFLSVLSGKSVRKRSINIGYHGLKVSCSQGFIEPKNNNFSGFAKHYCLKTLEKSKDPAKVCGAKAEFLCKSDLLAYIHLLQDCGKRRALLEGKKVHAGIISRGLSRHKLLGNLLITMYGKCDSLNDARRVFNQMPNRDVVTWNALIAAHVRHGETDAAIELFKEMRHKLIEVNKITFLSILGACVSPAHLPDGKLIHACIIDSGLESDTSVGTALFKMYGRCQSAENARRLFDRLLERDVVCWNAMIAVYSQHGDRKAAFELLAEMKREGVKPDSMTFVSLLNACSDPAALADGKKLHILLNDCGIAVDSSIANALMNMYSKCGNLTDSEKTFCVVHEPDIITWNTMLTAYCQHGQSKAAVDLFAQMQQKGVKPDTVTIVTALTASSDLADLQQGRSIHAVFIKEGITIDSVLATALVNMYAKCASLAEAQLVFDQVLHRDAILWAAIVAAYAQHGRAQSALQHFAHMQNECLQKPDNISMIHLLHACSHSGLLEEGFQYFSSVALSDKPVPEHYVCLVDLLGRLGRLQEAEDFIQSSPFKADSVIWTAFLGACRVHGDVERGRKAANILVELDRHNAAPYVILSRIYRAAGRQKDAEDIRKLMIARHVKKWADLD